MRVEINKLSTVDHPNIVQFLGLCVVSFSIILEWAPKGNLNQIIDEYIQADLWICPDTMAKTVFQVLRYRTCMLVVCLFMILSVGQTCSTKHLNLVYHVCVCVHTCYLCNVHECACLCVPVDFYVYVLFCVFVCDCVYAAVALINFFYII